MSQELFLLATTREDARKFWSTGVFSIEKEISMVGMINFSNTEEKLSHLESLKNIPSINPKQYDPQSEFHRLDYIAHGDHGIGFVEEVLNETRIKVFFSSGEQVLQQKAYLAEKTL